MDNLNNPPGVPGESLENSAEAGNVNDNPTEGTLAEINKATGRNYATLEDATQGMTETYGFMGKLSEVKDKAEKYDQQQAAKSSAQQAKDVNADKWANFDKQSFLYANPAAASVAEDVYSIAQAKGISMEQAYQASPLKGFVDQQAAEQAPATGSLAPSGAISGEGSSGPVNRDDFNKLSLDEQRKLVGTFSSANQKVGKGIYKSSQRNA